MILFDDIRLIEALKGYDFSDSVTSTPVTFSGEFEAKMERLIRKKQRSYNLRVFSQRAAAAVVVIALLGSFLFLLLLPRNAGELTPLNIGQDDNLTHTPDEIIIPEPEPAPDTAEEGIITGEDIITIDLSYSYITDEILADKIASGEIPQNTVILDLSHNQTISDVTPLKSLTKLTVLHLEGNRISDITPLESLTGLICLQLERNQVSDITPLESLTKLTVLNLGSNQISDITPVQSLVKLTELHLGTNQISDITPVQSLTMLTKLHLGINLISDIKPLESLTNLKELGLLFNQISDISPLGSLTNLTNLDLQHNQISDVTPLGSLTNLTLLILHDNQISDTQIRELRKALPNCEIQFDPQNP